MTRATHSAVGVALGLALALQSGKIEPLDALVAAGACAVSALVPDLDIRLGLKHRGITHSFLALIMAWLLTYQFLPRVALNVAAGYGSHLLLDALTVHGIPLLYPIKRRFRLANFTTGATMDGAIFVCAALVTIYLFGRL